MFQGRIKMVTANIKELLKKGYVRNIVVVAVITLLIKLVAFYKETYVAASFGLSQILDSFYIAILIPSFIQAVFLGSVKNIFIPNYITELSNKISGNKGGFQSLGFLTILSIVVVFTLITFLFEKYFLITVFPGHTDYFYGLIRTQLYILTPCLFFWGCPRF